jgi:hypothetical protein
MMTDVGTHPQKAGLRLVVLWPGRLSRMIGRALKPGPPAEREVDGLVEGEL